MTVHATVVLTHPDREPIVYTHLASDEREHLLDCARLDKDRGLATTTVFYAEFESDYVTCGQWETGKGQCGALIPIDWLTSELPARCPLGHPTAGSG